jgi:hypothetical protein
MTGTPHKRRLYSAIQLALWVSFALLSATVAHATAKPAPTATDITAQADSPFALADFDGDRQPDIATVQVGQVGASQTRYWIHFRLSSGMKQFIPVNAPIGGLRIASRDVNGDSFVDLIVTTALRELPVAVLLNDGRGNFSLRDPRAFPSVMASPRASLASAPGNVGDIAAALPPSSASGRCESVHRTALAGDRSGPLCRSVSHQKNFCLVQSVLGRAPPISILHV